MTETADVSTSRLPRVDRGLKIVIWCVSAAFLCGLALADPDLWGHTLYGIRASQLGLLCEPVDPFSYTAAGARWVNHEWLSEYLCGWLWLHFGNAGLWGWRNFCVLIVLGIAARELCRQRASLAAWMTLLLFSATGLSHYFVFVRPQLGTFVLFTASLYILRRWWEAPTSRSIWWLPVGQAVWVNLHGGWLAGWGLIVLVWLAALVRAWADPEFRSAVERLTGVLALATVATLVNPYGWEMHTMLWDHLATDQVVREWQPLWGVRQSVVYYVPFLLLGLSLPAWRKWSLLDAWLVGVVGLQALNHLRHIALLDLTLLLVLPGPMSAALGAWFPQLSVAWSRPEAWKRRLAGGLCLAAILVTLQVRGTVYLWRAGIAPWDVAVESRSDVPGMPLRALAFLKQQGLRGNLLTDYGWGQCAIWHLFPDCKVGFDGRYRTIYSPELEAAFVAFQKVGTTRPARTPMLDDWPTEIVLWPATRPVISYMEQRTDWRKIYADDQAVVYVRTEGPYEQRLVARPEAQSDAVWQTFPGDSGRWKTSRTSLTATLNGPTTGARLDH